MISLKSRTSNLKFAVALAWMMATGSQPANAEQAFTNSIGVRMLPIPAGEFEMGNPNPEIDEWDEVPVHTVKISQPFSISETEITVEQFREFQPEFTGSGVEGPYAVGIGWNDANQFCEWLSEKEGKPYRLPTEAEWEYAARARTKTPFWSGEAPPEEARANLWGLLNVHSGPSEWCYDWYGPYIAGRQVDPVGRSHSLTRVIRGGGLDQRIPRYARSSNRAGYAPSFAMMEGTEPTNQEIDTPLSTEPELQGLIGLWYGRLNLVDPKALDQALSLDLDWKYHQQPGEDRGDIWSAKWEGVLVGPADGDVTFSGRTDYGMELRMEDRVVIAFEGSTEEHQGSISMKEGKAYPIVVEYTHDRSEASFLEVEWSWEGQERESIPRTALFHSPEQRRQLKKQLPVEFQPGHHSIGFRIVQAPLPETPPLPEEKPFVRECVHQTRTGVEIGPDPSRPWFRRRSYLPIPLENVTREETRAAGFHPAFMGHNHNPGLVVCPNGDLLAVLFSAEPGPGGEDVPEVGLLAARLRYGAAEWDFPDPFIDFPDVNDTSSCLWEENERLYCFWGHTFYGRAYPFQWIVSTNNGASWSETRFPQFVGEVGPRTNQPINSIVRDKDGTLYIPSDGKGGSSALWATKDEGEHWVDPGGRAFGRHTSFALLKDGRILGMGGKNTEIDGYMPKSITSDGGKTYEVSRTPFPALGTQQRPTLIRLQSGRLFFAGDLQHRIGKFPEGVKERGVFVALSEDEGETWRMKKLAGTLPYDESHPFNNEGNPHDTMGYTVARQAANGVIHLIGTMNHPNQHYELNEAWILSEDAGFQEETRSEVRNVRSYEEEYPDGKPKVDWSAGNDEEGRYRLDGRQTWFYENNEKQWEVDYKSGFKVGEETYWNSDGLVVWSWRHDPDGTKLWTQYWANGEKKSESSWKDGRAEGVARRWDRKGNLIQEAKFANGRME
jgi:hypothetical protein